MKSNLLITGPSGFLGSHLLSAINPDNYNVFVSTRKSVVDEKNFYEYIYIDDIGSETDWVSISDKKIDIVIHTAAIAHDNTVSIQKLNETNFYGTLNLARQMAASGCQRFIFISSIGVNGNETFDMPFSYSDEPAPCEPYAVSKYNAELGLKVIADETGMELTIIRPPLVYGPDAPGNFNKLMKAVSHSVPLPLGSIDNKRSFVYIGNLVDLIINCINNDAAANKVFLVSDDTDFSTTDFLSNLCTGLDKPAMVFPFPQFLLDTILTLSGKKDVARSLFSNLELDIDNTKLVLDWCPPYTAVDALKDSAQSWCEINARR